MELGEAYHLAVIIQGALDVLSTLQMDKKTKVLVSMVFILQFIYIYMGSGPCEVLKDS